ncbi:PTS system, glucitol/sorbitol-specific IIC component [Paramixta manurensis]|uniref:PTS system, glucitol/sorbitol-specific IIC component n=1 Tax=Paramixta manurensis TaxID=2740817 RepID=A0A6M8UED6_9GAMM|nr:PTS system, glucitol/sorbitol-specific IIC component [Erwiniaceae bacterium PD-1]
MIVEFAEGFIHLFQSAGKIFAGMISSTIPMLITLILAVNFIMKVIGQKKIEKFATLMGRSKILTYGILPSFAWFFLSSPGALTLGKFLPERCKPAYQDALGSTAHPLTSLFPHVVPSELFIWLGVAAGLTTLNLPVADLAIRYIAAAVLLGFIRGFITEFIYTRLENKENQS